MASNPNLIGGNNRMTRGETSGDKRRLEGTKLNMGALLKRLWNTTGSFRWLLLFVPIPISQTLMLNLLNRIIPLTGQTTRWTESRKPASRRCSKASTRTRSTSRKRTMRISS